MESRMDRRQFVKMSSFVAGASLASPSVASACPWDNTVDVELPRYRVPLSFIIDDSTCLVNMGRYCMPQFAEAWPERDEYRRPWERWPHEIPDDFVRRFGTWSAEQGVKGKYSIVPYPACVGWLDRELPGWSRQSLRNSLQLVRDLMVPNWDIHPEMITHTRLIDLKTGRPMEPSHAGTMENSFPQEDKSVDELASYLAYALKILKNCDLPCEGITTPGGFGNKVKEKLPLAVFEAVRDVYGVELPHYFKYVIDDDKPTVPKMEALRSRSLNSLQVTVNVPAGTGDWFGGWDGSRPCEDEKYCSRDGSAGRMVELIQRRQPAIMLCHWAGLYGNGEEEGFKAFQRIVRTLHAQFADVTQWMKVSQIARYWAAKELTRIDVAASGITLEGPLDCPNFTIRVPHGIRDAVYSSENGNHSVRLREVSKASLLEDGTFWAESPSQSIYCFSLRRGTSQLSWHS